MGAGLPKLLKAHDQIHEANRSKRSPTTFDARVSHRVLGLRDAGEWTVSRIRALTPIRLLDVAMGERSDLAQTSPTIADLPESQQVWSIGQQRASSWKSGTHARQTLTNQIAKQHIRPTQACCSLSFSSRSAPGLATMCMLLACFINPSRHLATN